MIVNLLSTWGRGAGIVTPMVRTLTEADVAELEARVAATEREWGEIKAEAVMLVRGRSGVDAGHRRLD